MIKNIETIYWDAANQIREKGGCHAEHASQPYHEKPVFQITADLGLGFPLGLATEKIMEAKRLADNGKKREAYLELLGALNYTASAAMVLAEPEWVKNPEDAREEIKVDNHVPQDFDGNPLTPAEKDAPDKASLDFRRKAKSKSGFRYDYSHTVYRGDDVPVEIVDKICGRHFWMKPEDFMTDGKFVVCAHCALDGLERTGKNEQIDPVEVKSKRKLEDFGPEAEAKVKGAGVDMGDELVRAMKLMERVLQMVSKRPF